MKEVAIIYMYIYKTSKKNPTKIYNFILAISESLITLEIKH